MSSSPEAPSPVTGQDAAAAPSAGVLPRLPADAVLATIGRFATRYPDGAWLDLLALRASGGRSDAAGLVARSRSGDLDGTDARDLAWFGYVFAAELGDRADLDDVADILGHAMATQPRVGPKVHALWLQVLLRTGRLDAAGSGPAEADIEPDEWWAVSTDLLNPVRTGTGSTTRWLESLSRPFARHGLVPLRLDRPAPAPFDRMTTEPVAAIDGDLVSVVMPVYNPGPSLLTSVRSVLAQSWSNIEVLLCDDASTRGHDLLEEAAGLDTRVRLLRSPRNGGAYGARNLGLAEASGRHLTFQDSDDWSHPQRLERELAALDRRPGAVATVGHTLRATESLLVAALGLRKVALNLSSLLVLRDPVVEHLGAFDTVRRSGDREFLGRVGAVFGDDAVVTLPEPLAVCQLTPGSLSRGDMGFLRRHAARQAYATTAGAWHRAIEGGRESPTLHPPARAPFPAPAYIASGSASDDAGSADVALLANPAATAPAGLDPMVDALCEAGLRVAVVEFTGPADTTRQPEVPGDALADRFRSGEARWVLPGERVRVPLALVHDPAAVLTMPVGRLADVHADHLVVVADRAGDYDAATVAERASRASAGSVHWLPAGEAVALELRRSVPAASLLSPARWLVLPDRAGAPRPASSPPVVGLVPPRDVDRRARRRWERTRVPHEADTAVWCLGNGRSTIGGREVRRVGSSEGGWSELLEGADYLVLPPMPTPHLTRQVVEAWANGTVVIAEDALRPHLGAAAAYPGSGTVDACIDRLAKDPGQHAAIQGRGLEWVRRYAAPERLVATHAALTTELERRTRVT